MRSLNVDSKDGALPAIASVVAAVDHEAIPTPLDQRALPAAPLRHEIEYTSSRRRSAAVRDRMRARPLHIYYRRNEAGSVKALPDLQSCRYAPSVHRQHYHVVLARVYDLIAGGHSNIDGIDNLHLETIVATVVNHTRTVPAIDNSDLPVTMARTVNVKSWATVSIDV